MKMPRSKPKIYKGEAIFENDLARSAKFFKCRYVKIPDAIKTRDSLIKKKGGGHGMIEAPRPCDGVLSTVKGNFLVELKFDDGRLKEHQAALSNEINRINGSFYVLRKRLNRRRKNPLTKPIYSVEKLEDNKLKIMLKSEKIEDLYQFFS